MTTFQSSKKKLVTLILASNRPDNMKKFFDNVQKTVDDPAIIEVLVKIDEGDAVMQALLENAIKTYDFEIRYIQNSRLDGYYTLHLGYQQLFEISDKNSYFLTILSEEVRFKTQGWDTILAKYVGFFEDDLFRLRISKLKYRNYYSFHDCGPTPDNFPFLTRRWMELAGGVGDCWGPDGWHQYIDYHLGLIRGVSAQRGIFRSVPIRTIEIGGEEAAQGLTPEQSAKRAHRIFQEWWRMYRTEAQKEFRHIATRMAVYVWAKKQKLNNIEIIDDETTQTIKVLDARTKEITKTFSYYLSGFYIKLQNFYFLIKMARWNSAGFLKAFEEPSYGPKTGFKKYMNQWVRARLVKRAVKLAPNVARSETTSYKPNPYWLNLINYFSKG